VFLLEALRRYPRIISRHPRRETRYSHIIVRIPECDYFWDDRVDSGSRQRELIRELQRRHHARYPVEDMAIRYRVEPDNELHPGEVRFLFGPAIYIPSEREAPLFHIQAAIDEQDEWCDLGAIYAGQRWTLLNSNRCASSFPVTAWPFASDESLLLRLSSEPPVSVEILAEPADGLIVTEEGAGSFLALDRQGQRLRLRIMPLTSDVKAPVPRLGQAPKLLDHYNERTKTWSLRQMFAGLHIVGIALQRLSAYAKVGVFISDWRLSFNRTGELTLDIDPETVACLRIDSADQVFGEAAGRSTLLKWPGAWRPSPKLDLQLELYAFPESMQAHYLGWMRLPTPLSLEVPAGREVSFGRGPNTDIAPRLLADPGALRWGSRPARTRMNAEYLGLSRNHLRLQVFNDHWRVQLESQSMPVYRLALSGDLLDMLMPGVQTLTQARPGELLIAGCYVLMLGAV
jgi:hypothetical protein